LAKLGSNRLYHIPVLSKALDILEFLQTKQQSVSFESVYEQTKFSKTTVYRILKTFERRRYVTHQDGLYRLMSHPSKLLFGFGGQSEELPFSQAVTASLKEAAAASGVDLLVLDNRHDAQTALRNAEAFVQKRVDLVIEFQIDQQVAPILADKIARAGIPLIAVEREIPHPHATFFGVDNYRVGFSAGEFLGHHAKQTWKGNVKWVLGLDIEEAGALVQSRITGAFEGVREILPDIPVERFVRIDTRGLYAKSYSLMSEFLRRHPKDWSILVAAADDTSALGALRAVRQLRREKHVAIVGQDSIPDALDEMRVPGTPLIASVSREVHTYGGRLMTLGLALVRGQHIGSCHYVNHKLIAAKELAAPNPPRSPSFPNRAHKQKPTSSRRQGSSARCVEWSARGNDVPHE
jgi:ribose transport system substrate-binding protein